VNGILNTLKSLGTGRLILMGVVAAILLTAFIALSTRLSQPNMSLLFGDLSQEDSGQIVAMLDQQNVAYELRSGGAQIFVPEKQALRLRVTMATEGLPTGGSVGYSLFDKVDNLGTSSFVQNVNLLRALEGELARTIRDIEGVSAAKVRLVFPKRQLFTREKLKPRASIFVKLVGNRQLSNDQVNAIQYLVSSAVADLQPSDVTVVDKRGRLLSEPQLENKTGGAAADQQRAETELRLKNSIQAILEQSVGIGNVRVTVAADMDFDRTTTNSEIYDPDGQVARSTQSTEEVSSETESRDDSPISVNESLPETETGLNGANVSSSSRTEETTNFEIARTVKTTVRDAAIVKRLSAAVLVNDIPTIAGDGTVSYEPRSSEDLQKIETLVKTAIGFDESRGDQVQVVAMQFAVDNDAFLETEENLGSSSLNKADYFRIGEILALVIVAVLLVLLVIRPLVSRLLAQGPSDQQPSPTLDVPASVPLLPGMTKQQIMENPDIISAVEAGEISQSDFEQIVAAAPTTAGTRMTLPDAGGEGIDIAMIEGRVKASSIRKIGELVDKHPEEAVAIMRSWMYQDA